VLGQPPLGPDRVGQRPHHPIPIAGLDARGLEDQVTAGDDPAYPRLVLIDDGERDDVQPEDPQPAQLAIAASVTIILDLDVMRPSRRRTSLLRTSASGRLGLASSPGWPIDVRPGPLTGPRAPLPVVTGGHHDPESRARGGLSASRDSATYGRLPSCGFGPGHSAACGHVSSDSVLLGSTNPDKIRSRFLKN
jgi:hypothetical protein